jgi:hypothetical protein
VQEHCGAKRGGPFWDGTVKASGDLGAVIVQRSSAAGGPGVGEDVGGGLPLAQVIGLDRYQPAALQRFSTSARDWTGCVRCDRRARSCCAADAALSPAAAASSRRSACRGAGPSGPRVSARPSLPAADAAAPRRWVALLRGPNGKLVHGASWSLGQDRAPRHRRGQSRPRHAILLRIKSRCRDR